MTDQNDGLIDNLATYFPLRNEPNFAFGNTVSAHLLIPGLTGFWPMSSHSAAGTVYDLSGQGYTMTPSGTPAFLMSGIINTIQTVGSSYVYHMSDTNVRQTRTVMGWMKYSPIPDLTYAPIASVWGPAGQRGWVLEKGSDDRAWFSISIDGTNNIIVRSTNPVSDNEWHFYAGRFKTGVEIAVFLDDKKNVQGTPWTTIKNSTANLDIGAADSGARCSTNALITMVAISNQDISDTLIRMIYYQTKHLFVK